MTVEHSTTYILCTTSSAEFILGNLCWNCQPTFVMGYQSVSEYIVPTVVVYSEFTVNWSDYFLSKQVGLNQKSANAGT